MGFLRKFLGGVDAIGAGKSSKQTGAKAIKSSQKTASTNLDDNKISSKEEAKDFFKRINMESEQTAAMFGCDRGREDPLITAHQGQIFSWK